jgi:uncharacterized protein YjdB
VLSSPAIVDLLWADYYTDFAISPSEASVCVGESVTFVARARTPEGYWHDVTDTASWESSDPAIASLDGPGVVTGVAPGTAVLAAWPDPEDPECFRDEAVITVEACK